MSCLRRTILFLIGVSFQFSFLFAQTDNSTPSETLTWNLEDYEDERGEVWTTARFETLRGALYTLQSSPDLDSWIPLQSFYALSSELHLALFSQTPSVGNLDGDPNELERVTHHHLSFQLRPFEE